MVKIVGDKVHVNGKVLTLDQAKDLYEFAQGPEGKAIIKMVTPSVRGVSADKMAAIRERLNLVGSKISADRIKKCRVIPKYHGDDMVGFKAVLVIQFGDESREFSFTADQATHPSVSVESRNAACNLFINTKLMTIT